MNDDKQTKQQENYLSGRFMRVIIKLNVFRIFLGTSNDANVVNFKTIYRNNFFWRSDAQY